MIDAGDAGDASDADALPLPPVFVAPPPASNAVSCADAGATLIYVVTQSSVLLSFDPPTATFQRLGILRCPIAFRAGAQLPTPFSMAVDRAGVAFIVYNDGELFRVPLSNPGQCVREAFSAVSSGNFTSTYGMGFSTDTADGGEILYLAGAGDNVDSTLATLSGNFVLQVVGPFVPTVIDPELTGTGAGELYAFYSTNPDAGDAPTAIARIDRATAHLVTKPAILTGVPRGMGWAFGVWGGDFYTFTLPPNATGSVVTRYRPSDGSITRVAQLPNDTIVGAGVSTCAPQQQ